MIINKSFLKKSLAIRLIFSLITLFCLPNNTLLYAQEQNFLKDVVVAVIDQGVDFSNPSLQSSKWNNNAEVLNGLDDDGNGLIDDVSGWNFIANNNQLAPQGPHATRLAGIITKISPQVKIMSLTVCEKNSGCNSGAIVSAIYYAVSHGAQIINLSFGDVTGFSDAYSHAINYAAEKGVVVVAAAGGDGIGYDLAQKPISPVCNEPVIGVSSVNEAGQLPIWANFGNCVDIYAPGVNITTATSFEYDSSNFGSFSGTSYSAAIVSGFAANAKLNNFNITQSEIIELFKNKNTILTESNKVDRFKKQSKPKVKGVSVVKIKKTILPEPKQIAVIKPKEKFR